MQHDKPIAFFSRKLNKYQFNHGAGEKRLLLISKLLEEHCLILKGHQLVTHADYKNLTHPRKVYEKVRVIRQRICIKEVSAKILCMKGDNNDMADAMSRIPQKKEILTSEEIF